MVSNNKKLDSRDDPWSRYIAINPCSKCFANTNSTLRCWLLEGWVGGHFLYKSILLRFGAAPSLPSSPHPTHFGTRTLVASACLCQQHLARVFYVFLYPGQRSVESDLDNGRLTLIFTKKVTASLPSSRR